MSVASDVASTHRVRKMLERVVLKARLAAVALASQSQPGSQVKKWAAIREVLVYCVL